MLSHVITPLVFSFAHGFNWQRRLHDFAVQIAWLEFLMMTPTNLPLSQRKSPFFFFESNCLELCHRLRQWGCGCACEWVSEWVGETTEDKNYPVNRIMYVRIVCVWVTTVRYFLTHPERGKTYFRLRSLPYKQVSPTYGYTNILTSCSVTIYRWHWNYSLIQCSPISETALLFRRFTSFDRLSF